MKQQINQTSQKSSWENSRERKRVYLLFANVYGFYDVCTINLVTIRLQLMGTIPNDIYQVIFLDKKECPTHWPHSVHWNVWFEMCHFSWNFCFLWLCLWWGRKFQMSQSFFGWIYVSYVIFTSLFPLLILT